MDLALNNLQGLICHKSQTNKQTNKQQDKNISFLFRKVVVKWLYEIESFDKELQ